MMSDQMMTAGLPEVVLVELMPNISSLGWR
jgi:hypothetical protein